MLSLRALIGAIGLVVLGTGCIVVPGVRHGHHGHYRPAVSCHPSQYWDGAVCRHKGQGSGARKHDASPVPN